MKKTILAIVVIVIATGSVLLYLWRSGVSIPGISIFLAEEAVPQPPELPE